MRCAQCRHENPPRSRFCNQCGARIPEPDDATEEVAPAPTPQPAASRAPVVARKAAPERPPEPAAPVPFGVPGSAEGRAVPIPRVLYPSIAAANAALIAVGAVPQQRLQVTMNVPGVGDVVRLFGVMGNHLAHDEATEAGNQLDLLAFSPADLTRLAAASNGVSQRAARVLRGPDNERILARLKGGRLKYLPVNRALARNAELDLAKAGLHLPWSVNGLDLAFAGKCRDVLKGFGFVCFYGQLGRLEQADGVAQFKLTRMVSVPFGVDGVHTWDMEIADDVVDQDCGLLVEANARPLTG